MIGFRDRTFCSASCAASDCWRYFGDAQREAARAWWGGEGAPVSMADFSPTCPDYAPLGAPASPAALSAAAERGPPAPDAGARDVTNKDKTHD